MKDLCGGQLKLYSNVTETSVDWLWYPYIPFGKLTLVQGDPGCGKSTLMVNVIAALSNGSCAPDGRKLKRPMHVIYQCSEDGAGDTIKPRLNAAGADCSNVAFLDEEMNWITLADEMIRRAIADFNAKLLIIDPIQAYLGESDLASASGMRKVLRQLSVWASLYDCAIVLIGHLNKKQNSKDLYRGLGSIDLIAAARSVIQIELCDEQPGVMALRHLKSSLAPRGKDLFFAIDEQQRIKWIDQEELADLPDSDEWDVPPIKMSKQAQAAELLKVILAKEPIKSTEVQALCRQEDISEKTLLITKKTLGIRSIKRDGVWYWQLPNSNN